ncbi:MAG: hypothetical protein RLZZ602_1377 [Pseudomonadota bacterium]
MLTLGQRKYELVGTVGMAAIAMLCAPLAMAKKPSGADLPFSKDHLVYVDFDKPNDTDGIPMVSRSNWPLGITITIPYDTFWTGEGAERGGHWWGSWRSNNTSNYIFFGESVYNCYYLEDGSEVPRNPAVGCPRVVTLGDNANEDRPVARYIEFTSDIDQKGIEDGGPRGDLREDIGNPEFAVGVTDAELFDDVRSGWGIGTDDDLPSLFLYAEVGSGFVWSIDPDTGELVLARGEDGGIGVRNLAGLSNSVTYSESVLNKIARSQEVEIHSVIRAPMGLLDPVVAVDTNPAQTPPSLTNTGWISGGFSNDYFKWRVDGGEVEPMPESEIVKFVNSNPQILPKYGGCVPIKVAASAYLMSAHPVTVKAFVVSGTAPFELFDENGDGDYVDDAIRKGHKVLSNVAEVELLIDPLFDLFGPAVRFGPDNGPVPQFFKTSYRDLDALSDEEAIEQRWVRVAGKPPVECEPNGSSYIRREPR